VVPVQRGNIIVDFFSSGASPATQARLDRLGALLLALTMALLAWRSSLGGLSAWHSGSGTMLMSFPTWIVYAAMVPPLILTAVIALVQAVRGFSVQGDDGPPQRLEAAVVPPIDS
jgi:Tripartite ATP-independent periplasmic transporters, DctQ component.